MAFLAVRGGHSGPLFRFENGLFLTRVVWGCLGLVCSLGFGFFGINLGVNLGECGLHLLFRPVFNLVSGARRAGPEGPCVWR